MKLDIGSGNPEEGEERPEGYLLNDVFPHPGIDVVCNILDLENHFKPETLDQIRASHVLEHFSRKEVKKVLKIVHNLLKNNGSFLIIIPNFMWHVEMALKGQEEEAINHAYGGQLDEYDFHKNAFTVRTLEKLLVEHGFKIVTMLERASIRCLAIKCK